MAKIIIAGGRDFNDLNLMIKVFEESVHELDTLICGMAKGADNMAYTLAEERDIDIMCFPANWKDHGKGAGFIRNNTMANVADKLIAFWDGKSKGTQHMIKTAQKQGLDIEVHTYG